MSATATSIRRLVCDSATCLRHTKNVEIFVGELVLCKIDLMEFGLTEFGP